MLTKERLLESIKAMPEENFDIDVLLERIVLLDKIEKGEKDIAEGNVFTTQQAKEKLSRWLK